MKLLLKLKDISITKRKWKKIIKDFKENEQPGIIHQENNIVDNLAREFLINDENIIQTAQGPYIIG